MDTHMRILLLCILGWIGDINGTVVEDLNREFKQNRYSKRADDKIKYENHVVKRNTYLNLNTMYQCKPGLPPVLTYTSGNSVISEDNQVVLVGEYGSPENVVRYGLDMTRLSTFTIYSSLTQGTSPVCNTWYYITDNGHRVLVENSAVANYVMIPQNNPYNLVFTEITEAIQGSYLIIARNAYGQDTQLTHISILPRWNKTSSGIVRGSEGSLGQTLISSFGSEIQINGALKEWTLPWSFRWYYNGVEITQGQDYSLQDQGLQATLIIHNFQSTHIGPYTAIVNNRNGQDTHTFNLVAETGASCLCDYNYEAVVENGNACRSQLPLLTNTYGNITVNQDYQMVLVGGYGSSERKVNYGLDGDLVNVFIIYSCLIRGSQPAGVTWYFITASGERVLIENSAVASYVSVSQSNEYNLEFSQVGDFIQGTYLIVAENEHGIDRQLTHIGILPKWYRNATGIVTGTQGMLGQTVVGRFGSDIRITGIVREGTKPWNFRWYYNGLQLVEGTDYSFEYSGNQAIITIHNYQATDIREYTAVVNNRFGEDTHTFNLMAETVVSCNNNLNDLQTTTCINCQSNAQTKQSTLTVYAHSFTPNLKLTWFQVNKISGQRQQISENTVVLGANSIEVSVSSLCEYLHEVVVTGQNTYTFDCPCTDCSAYDGENTVTLSCCGGNQTLLRASDCGDDFFADVLLLIDVSAQMDVEHAFLRDFLPRFEESLQENCVGNSLINRNQYTAVAFGSLQENNKELPYFVGPDLNRGDSTQNVFFTIDVDNPINVTRTIDQLPTIGEREDGFAATKFAVEYAQLRDNSIKFAILVTDEARQIFYSTLQEAIDNSIFDPNNPSDLGRSLYSQLLLDNNIIPVQIIDITINAGTTQCLGVSSAETCFYRDPNSNVIRNLEFAEVVNTADSVLLANVHKDYLQPALNARGYAWDLKVIRENETGNWDAITTALTNDVLLRAREELTQCRDCRCLPGGVQCQIVPLDQQAICKCEKSFPNNQPYCTCITGNEERPDFCRCRHISGFSDATCRETGMITLVRT